MENTDTDRLNFLEKNLPQLGAVGRAPSGTWQMFTMDGNMVKPAETLRELLDDAISKINQTTT